MRDSTAHTTTSSETNTRANLPDQHEAQLDGKHQDDGMTDSSLLKAARDGASDADIHAIRSRAYECWCERGCPDGSPEVDWHRAQDEFRTSRESSRSGQAAGSEI
jgi:hypothetical protein